MRKGIVKIIAAAIVLLSVLFGAVALIVVSSGNGGSFASDELLFSSMKNAGPTKFYYDSSGAFGKDKDTYIPLKLDYIKGGDGHREWYEISQIPQILKDAFIAVEDRAFYNHRGVNIRRTIMAALRYLVKSENGFGGSTITQQVIKNISGDNERTVKRKINEILRAFRLEHKHSKDEIFEMYLNVIPMGQGVYGVGLASQAYFGKDPLDLTVSEAAALVGITNAPSRYNPYKNYNACIEKRNTVLYSMRECGYIDDAEYKKALKEKLVLNTTPEESGSINSWFVETVCDELCLDLVEKYHYSEHTARNIILNGGLHVYTTIDPQIQEILESYFEDSENFPTHKKDLVFSMTITDASSADLRAIVGSQGKKSANRIINYATTPTPPASALKPLALYAPLVDRKMITWSTVFDDIPIEYKINAEGESVPYPKNSPNVYEGLTTVADAIAYSKNTIAVRLYNLLGAEAIFEQLQSAYGFKTLVRGEKTGDGRTITDLSVAPLALGQLSRGISLRELTEAYTVFSSGGVRTRGRSYICCLDKNGTVIIEKGTDEQRVYSKETAQLLTQLLMNVVEYGTASRISRLRNICDVAGKTGTSSGSKSKLFVGYTPYYTAGIWCGYKDNKTAVYTSDHLGIWDRIMSDIHSVKLGYSDSGAGFSTQGLVYAPYCKDSGKMFSFPCSRDERGDRLQYGYFLRGTEPGELCDLHYLCINHDEYGCRIKAMLDFDRSVPPEITVSDEEYIKRKR